MWPLSSTSAAIHASHLPEDQRGHSLQQPITISTHDAIAALIWRSTILARHRAGILSDRITTSFFQPVDCRSRLQLPESYFGNAVYGIKATLDIAQLLAGADSFGTSQTSGLQAAARAIRAETSGVTAEKFRDLLGFVERTDMEVHTRSSVIEDLSIGSVFVSSYFGFEMHEVDFGEALGGKMEAFRLPSRGIMPGAPVVLPRLRDGGCEFAINEQEEVIHFLAEDEFFRRFATKQC